MRALLLSTLVLLPVAALAQTEAEATEPVAVTAILVDAEGTELGTADLVTLASGAVLVAATAEGIPQGAHGMHVHEVGDCTGPDFESAGGHIPGGMEHGYDNAGGPHPGDLPNVYVQPDGVLAVDHVSPLLVLDESMVFDADGSALIIHAEPDDYRTDPSGESGARIACGVIERADAG